MLILVRQVGELLVCRDLGAAPGGGAISRPLVTGLWRTLAAAAVTRNQALHAIKFDSQTRFIQQHGNDDGRSEAVYWWFTCEQHLGSDQGGFLLVRTYGDFVLLLSYWKTRPPAAWPNTLLRNIIMKLRKISPYPKHHVAALQYCPIGIPSPLAPWLNTNIQYCDVLKKREALCWSL